MHTQIGRVCPRRRRRHAATLLGVTTVLVLAGCAAPGGSTGTGPDAPDAGEALSAAHVHGVAVDPADGALMVATHDGLFAVSEVSGIERVGPVIDLMGFAVAGPGHFLASGHPGPGVDLPEPAGLIESTDGGRTWQQLSRQGQSDFHVLAVSQAGVLGFDGSLLATADRQTWDELAIPAEPFGLAASPDGERLLATTQQGLLRSADAGRSWTTVAGAPLLQVVDWAGEGESADGVDPTGGVWRSADGGSTWQQGAQLGDAPQAIDVSTAPGGARRIIVATDSALVESMDGGQTFAELPRG